MAKKSGIHINPAKKGVFSAKAKAAGQSVQGYAHKVMANKNASPTLRKEANFAINAKGFNHKSKKK